MGSLSDSSDSLRSLPLLQGTITLKSALETDDDILQRLAYPEQRIDFFTYLYSHRGEVEAIVSHHLGFEAEMCNVGEVKEWIAGSFNVCIPVYIDKRARHPRKRALIRFPLPYKIGETQFPGNADEKIRCEAAAFIWLQENCAAAVPIPYLWGFGFPSGQSFTTPERKPFYTRLVWHLRRTILSLLRYPIPCRYIGHRCPHTLGIGYLVMDYIEETDGRMLSESWEKLRHDRAHRTNLFKDLSHIILAMAQLSLPRIGSFTIDDLGVLSLTNRPLTLQIQQLENEGVPTQIYRTLTYSTSEAYVLDLLGCHDHRLRCKPNSIHDGYDGRAQMAALTVMRALYPHFLSRDLRHGPFIFTLTDLHQSNIFVDEDWHIKCLIDLEWACSLPVEMLHPPFWLTSRGIDQLEKGEHLEAYSSAHTEFLETFEEKEHSFPSIDGNSSYCTSVMRRGWKIGNFWYFKFLDSPKGLYNIFLQHIQPRFEASHRNGTLFDQVVSPYWAADAADVITAKIKDKDVYNEQLRKAFGVVEEHK